MNTATTTAAPEVKEIGYNEIFNTFFISINPYSWEKVDIENLPVCTFNGELLDKSHFLPLIKHSEQTV